MGEIFYVSLGQLICLPEQELREFEKFESRSEGRQ